MITSTKKIDFLEIVKAHLEIASIALGFYEKTNDKQFYDFALWFSGRSKELQESIKNL